ncbi:hypothetical protein DWB78_16790 [Halopelagius longus]|uniref:Uncharacterized protein n=1 Tax=Halopelagius longus TaxID=1236180 RepID=A0A370IGG5_9EURY|nr:hypothetical protein DWB78_16790 [Halopelagius longus]
MRHLQPPTKNFRFPNRYASAGRDATENTPDDTAESGSVRAGRAATARTYAEPTVPTGGSR